MYERILIGYQDTEGGRDALTLGTVLARASRAELILGTARTGNGETLAQLARFHRADLVVVGASHRGAAGRVLPGATVERLLGEAPCAVAVAPPGFGRHEDGDSGWRPLSGDLEDVGVRVVGVGYDGSRASEEALKTATDLAVPNGAALRVYTVARKYAHVPGGDGDSRGPGVPTEAEVLREMLHEAVAALPSEARALPVFLRGFAAAELVEASEAGVDLLVLGSRGGGPLRRKLHHSVTSTVMQEAKCPVLISPTGVKAPTPVLA
ncbi:MAG TPA: universal stress protein [Thermoanaerobaculia bacterium]|nr:universal stress protein [Thermoanaerobaculia bacterium]